MNNMKVNENLSKAEFCKLNIMMFNSHLPSIIYAASQAGIFDFLSKGKYTVDEMAKEMSYDKNVLQYLLDVLVLTDLVCIDKELYFASEEAKVYLTSFSALSQQSTIKSFVNEKSLFSKLPQVLKKDIPEFNYKMWISKEAIISMEQQSKAGMIQNITEFVKDIPQFKNAVKMSDLAGSSGYYALALMQENPNLVADVYDLKETCTIAKEIKQNEPNFNRINYIPCNLYTSDSFGEDYDLVFCSNFLYEFPVNGKLEEILEKVNKSMKQGGLFVSNHLTRGSNKSDLLLAIKQLITIMFGYPTHILDKEIISDALRKTGFGDIKITIDEKTGFPYMLLSAVKIKS